MPEVIRGSRSHEAIPPGFPSSPGPRRSITFSPEQTTSQPLTPVNSDRDRPNSRRTRSLDILRRDRRSSVERIERDVYYDSRAATKREFRRRATTLQQYYSEHPDLLPQLPFTFRHGFKRWKLGGYIALMVIDACVVPIILYYTMTFAGNVQGWIVFAVVATVWGGPTYVEFALRSWRLIKKEHFFRPLGVNSRWTFDLTHWILVCTIASVTALLIVGSAPHIVFLRVLSMPGPAILYALAIPLFTLTMMHMAGARAPFQLSSTPKGGKVLPGVYYLIEDIIAVNAGGGRPFREGLAARYDSSPIFRKMLRDQSLFWSIPALIIAAVCTVVVCIHAVPNNVGYGIGWGVPFLWAGIWAAITVPWVRAAMHKETVTWEQDNGGLVPSDKMTAKMSGDLDIDEEKKLDSPVSTKPPKPPSSPSNQPSASEDSTAPTAVEEKAEHSQESPPYDEKQRQNQEKDSQRENRRENEPKKTSNLTQSQLKSSESGEVDGRGGERRSESPVSPGTL